ncbi:MAG: ROK family protein [Verrucomicrobiota bacterium]
MSTEKINLGIDLGGTDTKAIAFHAGSRDEVSRQTTPTLYETADDGKPMWLHEVQRLIEDIEASTGCEIDRIGICAPGFAAPDETRIVHMPGRLQELSGLDWTAELNRPSPIRVLNDAQSALLGEIWQGAAAGLKNVFMLTLGTGVGGAVMCDGRLLKGHLGRAGHLGHVSVDYQGPPDICNTPGSIELAVGNATLGERGEGRYANTHELVEAANAGDETAQGIWSRSIKALAAHIASMVNVLDPEVVVIGGGIAVAGPALFDPLNDFMNTFEWRPEGARVKLVPAQLAGWAGAFGAAYNAWEGAHHE